MMNEQVERQRKSRIALIRVEEDLLSKGYVVFVPSVDYWLPFDIIAYDGIKMYKIQVKYSASGDLRNRSSMRNKEGKLTTKYYKEDDFDYYGVYLPDIKQVVYPSLTYGGKKITTQMPKGISPFYWWEDFTCFTDNATRKTFKDFGLRLEMHQHRESTRKVERPSREELNKLLWSIPTIDIAKSYGVSDKAISKWASSYGLEKPPRGYWQKLNNIQREHHALDSTRQSIKQSSLSGFA